MKLASFWNKAAVGVEPGHVIHLGVVVGERIALASTLGDGPATMAELLDGWPASLSSLVAAWAALGDDPATAIETMPLSDVELLAPVPRPGKIVAAGVNYRSHGAEQDREPPDHPVLFAKLATSVIGAGGRIRWSPQLTQAVDFEAELAVIIGRSCRRVTPATALEYVAGYTCLNDVSARDLQYADRQFVRGKSLDTFCPMGPWLVTADEIPDPQSLKLTCRVNGEVMQHGSTRDMVFSVAQLISFCSHAFTLEPGDVIATGTPAGVGWFRNPKRMLRDGDFVEVEIERIGVLGNECHEEVV